jgi:hypothetical protein
MTKILEQFKPELQRLYIQQKRPLEEVRALIRAKYGIEASGVVSFHITPIPFLYLGTHYTPEFPHTLTFPPSVRTYKNAFEKWGYKKDKQRSIRVASGLRKSLPRQISGNEVELTQRFDNGFSNGLFGYNWMFGEFPREKNESKTMESGASDVKWGSDRKFQGNGYQSTWEDRKVWAMTTCGQVDVMVLESGNAE